jgi:hypothetical protein
VVHICGRLVRNLHAFGWFCHRMRMIGDQAVPCSKRIQEAQDRPTSIFLPSTKSWFHKAKRCQELDCAQSLLPARSLSGFAVLLERGRTIKNQPQNGGLKACYWKLWRVFTLLLALGHWGMALRACRQTRPVKQCPAPTLRWASNTTYWSHWVGGGHH